MADRQNLLVIVGVLVGLVIGFFGYQAYQDHKEPKGVQINLGPGGVSVEKK
ncbi:MAG: hypothetical protein JO254_14810 [Pseudolabrys sp.]|nr:hypothetical protein [Pseudolabrys sp.]